MTDSKKKGLSCINMNLKYMKKKKWSSSIFKNHNIYTIL